MASGIHQRHQNGKTCPLRLQDFFSIWFRKYGRPLPWRKRDTAAFGILVAEVLLRQTRAEMVAEIWPSLVSAYPDSASLGGADPNKLESQIACLGLGRQRAGALIQLGRALVSQFKGFVPRNVDQLEQLPHIGLYSARAVACFAFGQRVPVVDVNVMRVLSRLKGLALASDIRRAKHIWRVATKILPPRRVKHHNYGLLDFAAAICHSRNPLCNLCPLAKDCFYFRTDQKRLSRTSPLRKAVRDYHERTRDLVEKAETINAFS
jgi:A/G-specific adenine glycosylase